MWDTLHHAYLLPHTDDALQAVRLFLSQQTCTMPSDTPDVFYVRTDRFAIGDARTLSERASIKPTLLPRRIVVVSCTDITNEAQQALLKTLEEPAPQTVFFFSVAAPHALLPTVRSRFVSLTPHSTAAISDVARQFAAGSYKEREVQIKELLATRSDDETHTLANLFSLLNGLEHMVGATPALMQVRDAVHALYQAKRALLTPAAALKPALEHVALLFPRLKA